MRNILILFLLSVLVSSCSNNQKNSCIQETPVTKSPDRYVDIGTHRVHINDFGKGSPVVVFVTGAGGAIDQWLRQVHEIDKYTRVITYDRAGLGKTENINKPRTLKGMTDELHQFLEKDEIPGPYILVAHSLGGTIIRYYQYLYPEKVAGMVFIDAIGDDSYERYEDFPEAKQRYFEKIDYLCNLYPGGIADETLTQKRREDFQDTMKLIGYPKNIPVKIICCMKYDAEFDQDIIIDQIVKNRRDSLFKEMAKNDTLYEYTSTDKSDHFIHLREPGLVNDAIIRMIKELRKE